MATYPIINKKTGERKIIEMSVHEITQWYNDNPEWKRDWSEGCANFGEVGEWKDKLIKQHSGWGEVMNKVKKMPGANQKIW